MMQVPEIVRNNRPTKSVAAMLPSDEVIANLRELVLEKYGQRCFYCGRDKEEAALTIDHVIPQARGGTHAIENLVPACKICNSIKCDREIWSVRDSLLFRAIRWHFTKPQLDWLRQSGFCMDAYDQGKLWYEINEWQANEVMTSEEPSFEFHEHKVTPLDYGWA